MKPTPSPPSPTVAVRPTPRGRPSTTSPNSKPGAQAPNPSFSLQPFLPPQRIPVQTIGTRRASGQAARRVRPVQVPPAGRVASPMSGANLAKYKAAEKKVRLAIVAAPIAIVTSWVLYNRLIKGEERKVLGRDVPDVLTI